MTAKSIQTTSVAERRRLRFELEDLHLDGSRPKGQRLGVADAYEAHKRRWKMTRTGIGPRSSGWRGVH
jgi:hypothetical protein